MNSMTKGAILIVGIILLVGLGGGLSAHQPDNSVFFEQSHGQKFLLTGEEPLGLSRLAGVLRTKGLTPQVLPGGITRESLRNVRALVVSGPFLPFSAAESEAVSAFVHRGGRLCLMLHIATPAIPLLQQLGVAVTNFPVRDQVNLIAGNPLNFEASVLAPHALTGGLDRFSVYGGWGLVNLDDNSEVLAATSPGGWSDLDGDGGRGEMEPAMALGVMMAGHLGNGQFVIVGDDAVFQNKFLTGGNLRLAENLGVWFKGGTIE